MRFSPNNGATFYGVEELDKVRDYIEANAAWIADFMDDDIREQAHSLYDGEDGDEVDFLRLYLEMAEHDLVMP